jgi:hypothetical protein
MTAMLSAEQSEQRTEAEREFAEFGKDATNRELRVWREKYAHLGLGYERDFDGTPHLTEGTSR